MQQPSGRLAGPSALTDAPAIFIGPINRLEHRLKMKTQKPYGSKGRKEKGRAPAGKSEGPRGKRSGGRPRVADPGDGRRWPHQRAENEKRPVRDSARPDRLWIYGRHAAIAALANPERRIRRALVAPNALEWIANARLPRERLEKLVEAKREDFERALHEGAVHQGLAVEVEDLSRARLKEACQPDDSHRPVVVLDQITDPHNIGAIFRSAAAFGARAIVVQDRRTPPLAGALAKAAAGAVELVPCVEVVNIARALEGLKALGYHCAGLAGEGRTALASIPADKPVALVLGAEGEGLRRLVAETCDGLYRIPISRRMESLNVSNAAAVALYETTRMGSMRDDGRDT